MNFLLAAAITFMGLFIVVPIIFGILRAFGAYTIVEEGTTHVYVLFGKVAAVLPEPGFYILWFHIGPAALIVNWLGKRYVLDRRLDQTYLRGQPVNSEEGAPMAIGVWYEMWISDPVSYLFKNSDPRGSMLANVSSATVRCLSNMKLEEMLENRHAMSRVVRAEVAPKSREWGFDLGSVYIRKVHFRDAAMIRGIEEKVTNRLRQVTSAIKQDGANQVGIITSTADRQAAVEFAKAAAMRPRIVGESLQRIGQDREVLDAMFDILEAQKSVESDARITFVRPERSLMPQLAAIEGTTSNAAPPAFSKR
jgi:regulator of protease activity HflC (stomatin/prohibitin superfamily)